MPPCWRSSRTSVAATATPCSRPAWPSTACPWPVTGSPATRSRRELRCSDNLCRLAAAAWSDDDLVEGVEIFSGWWFVGVQWHPEEFWADTAAPDAGLFRAFIAAAGEARR